MPGVTACQISWRSDSKALAVMQPNGLCAPTATGKIVGVDLSNPGNMTCSLRSAPIPRGSRWSVADLAPPANPALPGELVLVLPDRRAAADP